MRLLRSILGLLVVAGIVVVLVVVFFTNSTSGYQIKLNFADADGLLKGSRVEIGGVGVGSVESLKITSQDHALVTVAIDKADEPIGTNASAVVRPADLLGEKYIDLSVGNRAQPAKSGFTISAKHTQTATDFDQIVDVLGPTEQDRLAILIHETGVALYGRGTDVQELLKALPPSLTDAQNLINQVTASNDQLKDLITHSSGVMASLDTNQHALEHFVSTAGGALSATAQHSADLQRSVAEAPELLTQLDTTLKHLDTAGDNLRPAARGLETTAPKLTETLDALPGFTKAALPTLAEVRSISPQLVSLGRGASPVVAKLKPTLQKLAMLSKATKPVTNSLNSGIDNLLGTLQGWARALQTQDGLSHEFRVSASVPTSSISEIVAGLAPTSATSQKTGAKSSPAASGSATASGSASSKSTTTSTTATPAGGVSSAAGTVTSGVAGAVGKLLNGVSGAVGSVTGKHGGSSSTTTASGSSTTSTGSLSSLLGYLMGGK